MARPTQSPLSNSPSFTPQGQPAPRLGVYAPLNVTAAPTGAQQLASALGIINKTAQPMLEEKVEKQAQASASQGMLDEQLGKADAKRRAEDMAYEQGVKRVAVENATVKALSDWQSRYETEIDKSLGADAVAADFDQFMGERLKGFAGDSQAARWAYELLGPAERKVTTEHNAALAQQFKETTVATVSASIRAKLASNTLISSDEMKQMLAAAGFSRGEQASNYVDIIAALAIEKRSSKLLDALIPETWEDGTPGPRATPKLAEKINQARYYAEAAERQDEQEQKQAAVAASEAGFVSIMREAVTGNVGNARAMLDKLAANGTLTSRTDYAAMTNFIDSRLDRAKDLSFNPLKLAQFRMELAADPLKYTQSDVIQQLSTLVPQGKDGFIAAAQLLDDITSAQKAARAAETNPKAKAYRSSFVTRYKPEAGSTQAKKDRFAAGLEAFDTTFAETQDAEQAQEAANKVFGNTEHVDKTPVGNVVMDAAAFANGQIGAEDFSRKYGTASGVQNLVEAYRTGKTELTEDQYRKALLQLKGD